ncbi:hypothetical protein K402DRAFT_451067 [Aulographum hederae CBS 113979]|uniref:Mid2 domain-containing protein n=1 Tax=Aulographum hederae CBS 113979 TaxID=1176131 RepID=A0A6G1HCH1_9PEZI|nr:hypothetical protein K402DRAFT_451067 [Aulographum hederae CBS 113979]
MRPSGLLSALAILLTSIDLPSRIPLAEAKPLEKLVSDAELQEAELSARHLQNATVELVARCANPCGWSGQLCCDAAQACFTDSSNQAQCGPQAAATAAQTSEAGGGYWMYYTSTYVNTLLVTTTAVMSSYVGPAATGAAGGGNTQCNYAQQESPCGPICCASNQYCAKLGQCADAGGSGYTTAGLSAPYRPTSGTTVVATATVSPTTTVPFGTPISTGDTAGAAGATGGGGGLSGGAIAGIVIGVLVGIGLLLLLCLCCCAKGLLDTILACFGLGGRKKRRTEETTTIEEHHAHGHGPAGAGRTWYGASRPARVERQGSRFGGLTGIAAGLAGLWAILGLKRRHDKKHREKSDYSSSYDYSYTGTSVSSPSSVSRDHRTYRSSRR